MAQVAPAGATGTGNGRIQACRDRVSRDLDGLTGDCHAPGLPRFPGLGATAMAGAGVEFCGRTATARRFFLPPLCHLRLPRPPGITTRRHPVPDAAIRQDPMRGQTGPLFVQGPGPGAAPSSAARKAAIALSSGPSLRTSVT